MCTLGAPGAELGVRDAVLRLAVDGHVEVEVRGQVLVQVVAAAVEDADEHRALAVLDLVRLRATPASCCPTARPRAAPRSISGRWLSSKPVFGGERGVDRRRAGGTRGVDQTVEVAQILREPVPAGLGDGDADRGVLADHDAAGVLDGCLDLGHRGRAGVAVHHVVHQDPELVLGDLGWAMRSPGRWPWRPPGRGRGRAVRVGRRAARVRIGPCVLLWDEGRGWPDSRAPDATPKGRRPTITYRWQVAPIRGASPTRRHHKPPIRDQWAQRTALRALTTPWP